MARKDILEALEEETWTGTDENDILQAEQAHGKTINALEGDDTIRIAYKRKNWGSYLDIDGGEGNDTITVGYVNGTNDNILQYGGTVKGGAGDDVIKVIASNASIYGGDGNDTLINDHGASNVLLDGGIGDDVIDMDNENATVYGGEGNDSITVSGKRVTVNGGAGDDTIKLRWASDDFSTNAVVTGGAGKDTFILMQPMLGATITDLTSSDKLVLSINPEVADAPKNPKTKQANPLYKTDGRLSSLTASYSGKTLTLTGMAKQWKALSLKLTNITSVKSIIDTVVYNGSVNGALNSKNKTTLGKLLAAGKPLPSGAKASSGKIVLSNSFKGAFNLANYKLGDYYLQSGRNITASASKQKLTITGDDRANLITGGTGNDTLRGGTGNDTLQGGTGNDYLQGGTDNDYLQGGAGNDKLLGEAGNDALRGYAGNDTLTGGAGNDVFTYANGEGKDTITDYTANQDTLYITSNAISKTTLSGKNVVFTVGKGSVTLSNAKGKTISMKDNRGGYSLTSSAITLAAGFGGTMDASKYFSTVKTVDASKTAKAVNLTGNAAANTLKGNAAKNTLSGNAGNDTLYGYAGNDVLNGGAGNDSLDGGAGNDKLYGDAGNDWLSAGAGNDSLYGGAGNDSLYAGAGNDSLDGGDGNDLIYGREGNDTLVGGKGKDTFVYYTGSDNDVIKDYTQGEDTLQITNGSVSAAAISGKDLVLTVGGGKITMKNAAAKTVTVKTNNGNYTLNKTTLAAQANFRGTLNAFTSIKTVDGRAATKTVNLYGNSGANVIYSGKAGGTLRGGAGNDTLYGGAGKDVFYYDSGNDTIYNYDGTKDKLNLGPTFISTVSIVGNDGVLNLANGGTITIKGGATKTVSYVDSFGMTETFSFKDVIIGTNGNDKLLGNARNNKMYGRNGNDSMSGGNGADVIYGDAGNDTLDGGAGNDELKGGAGNDTIKGGADNDWLYGDYFMRNAKGDWVPAGNGNDYLDGGTGNDSLRGGAGKDTLFGGAGNDDLAGEDGNDYLDGGANNDYLTGGAGVDTFAYANGSGNDTIGDYAAGELLHITSGTISKTDLSGSNVVFTVGSGSVTLTGANGKTISLKDSRGSYTMSATALTLSSDFTGTMDAANYLSTITTIDGSKATKALNLSGNAQANTITGGAGADTLDGGAGDDYLYGGDGNDTLNGGAGDDYLNGGAALNTLTGGDGADVFYCGEGNDTITDYAAGQDTIKLGNLTVSSVELDGSDSVLTLSNGNTITVKNGSGKELALQTTAGTEVIRFINGTVGDDNGDNSLIGAAQRDYIRGFAGNDSVDGGDGDDTLHGGDGNDTLRGDYQEKVDQWNWEDRGNGNDKLYGGNGDDELYGGNGNDELYGGNDNDYLFGNAGNDSLDGGEGSDTLDGGEGNDWLDGGNGYDLFRCGSAENASCTIWDYSFDSDLIEFMSDFSSAALDEHNQLIITLANDSTIVLNNISSEQQILCREKGELKSLRYINGQWALDDPWGAAYDFYWKDKFPESSGMIANSAPIVGTSSAQLASLVSTTQTGTPGGLENTGLASPEASGSSLIAAGGASNPLTNKKTA